MENLWKGLDTLQTKTSNPVDLVKEQSTFLREGTREALKLDIAETLRLGPKTKEVLKKVNIDNQFSYRVSLTSAYLQEYFYNIFTFFYDITSYPMVVTVPKEIGTEVTSILGAVDVIDETETRMYFKVSDEDAFVSVMANIFNSENARMVMTNIKAIVGKCVEDEE